ncbi:MAG: hypothetical protein FJ356_06135 [Thaumarchaeota archaeon]|nr:hypothetical protein [Nitrososphaerota archaeon]
MSMTIISKTAVTSNTATVTLSNIPQTYDRLLVLCQVRDSGAYGSGESMIFEINEITTSGIYDAISLESGAHLDPPSTILNNVGTTRAYCGIITDDGQTSNAFSNTEILISNYSSTTTYKTIKTFSTVATTSMNTYRKSFVSTGIFESNTAVSSMKFSTGGSGIKSGSTFWIYGIKNS